MSESKTSSSGGIGFVGLLTIVFIVLKLLNKIDWSRWWVISPIWISVGIVITFLAVVGIVAFTVTRMNRSKR